MNDSFSLKKQQFSVRILNLISLFLFLIIRTIIKIHLWFLGTVHLPFLKRKTGEIGPEKWVEINQNKCSVYLMFLNIRNIKGIAIASSLYSEGPYSR